MWTPSHLCSIRQYCLLFSHCPHDHDIRVLETFLFLKKCLEDISPFCEATETLILDFRCCLPCVSKPQWIPHVCRLHSLYALESSDSPLVQHLLTSWWQTWQLSHSNPRIWQGLSLGYIIRLPHSVRPGRCSTD